MFTTILVPTDGSALSRQAEDAAIEFARRNGATVVALAVAEPEKDAGSEARAVGAAVDPREDVLAAAQERVQALVDRARAAEIPCQCSIAFSHQPHEEILRAATEFQCDVIFMASHGEKGLRRVYLGSETQKVLAYAQMPVVVFR